MDLYWLQYSTVRVLKELPHVFTLCIFCPGNYKAKIMQWILGIFLVMDYMFILFSLGKIHDVWRGPLGYSYSMCDMWAKAMEHQPKWFVQLIVLTMETILTPRFLIY